MSTCACNVCFSGSVSSERTFNSVTVRQSAMSNTEREHISTDTLPTTVNHCFPVTAESADVCVNNADVAESNNTNSCHMVVEKNASDGIFRVRPHRALDSGSGSSRELKVCEICGKVFRHYETFRSHRRRHDARRLPLYDSTSHKQFHQSTEPCLQTVVGSVSALRLMCEVCGLRGKNHAAFARHMRTYHPSAMGIENTGATFQCKSCDERFFRLRDLQHHFRLVHALNYRRYSRMKTTWFRRRKRPRDSGPPRCGYCARCFNTQRALEVHERVHTGVKPFACRVCGRCFRQSIHLATHQRTHTDERPFVCSVCKKAYKNRVDLRKHCSNKHGVSLPVRGQRGIGGIDMVAAAVAAANIRPDDADLPQQQTGFLTSHPSDNND